MLYFHSALSLELIALVSGVALFIFVKNQTKIKCIWPIIAAWAVIGLAVLSIICSAYYSVAFWNKGYPRMQRFMKERYMMKKNEDNKGAGNKGMYRHMEKY